jgi:hypothetical protein
MDASNDRRGNLVGIAGTTASPWRYSFGFWFAFTYLPPASLVGREASMR